MDSLFGIVVRKINTFFLPIPIETFIESLPTYQPISISDRSLGTGYVLSVWPVLLYPGGVKIEGAEWNSFVADRGIRVGDVLLLKLLYNIPNNIINIAVLRIDGQSNRTIVPPLPQQPHHHHLLHLKQPFLCVKKLSEADVSGRFSHQIPLPTAIAEAVTDPGELYNGGFLVRVRDQTCEHIQMETRLKLRVDGELLFGDNWSELVAERGLRAEDVVVFCVDLGRRIITTTVCRSHPEQNFLIPSAPFHGHRHYL